jgi:hypothetical protein
MAEVLAQDEQWYVDNEFGAVTNKRVIFFRKKGWFSGGSREDIPLRHITSVRLETARSIIIGLFLLLVGLGSIGTPGGAKAVGVICLILGFLLLWGSPKVVVNTAGRDLNAAKGLPWQRSSANAFVEALRQQLFNETAA